MISLVKKLTEKDVLNMTKEQRIMKMEQLQDKICYENIKQIAGR